MAVKDVTRRAEWWVPGRSNHHFFGSSDFLVKLKSLEGVGIGLRQAGRLIGHMSTSVEQLQLYKKEIALRSNDICVNAHS